MLLPLLAALRAIGAPVRSTLRWNRPPRLTTPLAVIGVVAALAPVLWVATRFVQTPAGVEEFFTRLLRARSTTDLAVVIAAAAIVPALTEEILFRGLLQGALERRLGRWPGVLIAAAAFGAIHGPARALTAGVLGAVLGWTASRTRSVVPAAIAHAAVNTIAVSLVNSPGFGTGQGWPETLPVPALLAWTGISVVSLGALARVTRAGRSVPA